jgi:hypothetical protein
VARLPFVLARLAAFLPSAALADVLRFALLPGAGAGTLRPALTVLCAWALAAPALAAFTFRWE